MSEIEFTCPHCQTMLSAEAHGAGREKRCPKCGETLIIPAPMEAAAETGAADEQAVAPPPRRVPRDPVNEAALPRPARVPGASRKVSCPSAEGTGFQAGAVTASLVAAVQPRRILFWILAAGASLLVCGLLGLISFYTFVQVSKVAGAVLLLLTVLLFIGSAGVVAGGVAYFAIPDERRSDTLLPFLIRHGVALMGGPILFLLAWILVYGLGNGLVGLINKGGAVGSFFGALMFLPQAAYNGALALALLVWVLIPCAVVVEHIGPHTAILRLVRMICTRPASLLAHTGITVFYSMVLTIFVTILLGLMLLPTLQTNGPDIMGRVMSKSIDSLRSFVPEPMSPPNRPAPSSGDQWWNSPAVSPPAAPAAAGGQRGDNLRIFFMGLLLIIGQAVPIVFWVTSFAHFQVARSEVPTRGTDRIGQSGGQ